MSRSERGFTLVEMLVSIAILSIAFAVLFGAISSSLDRARKAKDEALASALVQSLLARTGARGDLAPRETTGTYSNGFRWRMVVRPYGDPGDAKAWHLAAYRVNATVSWPGGERSLSTLRLVPPATPP
jgi:prepilin-type N-terminal cleavage/methylation domain-containing protein